MVRIKNIVYFRNLIILFVVLFSGCKEGDGSFNCFEQQGNITTLLYYPSSFKTIIINDVFEVILKQDSIDLVEITGGDNLVGDVEIKVVTDSLVIKNNISCNWIRAYNKIKLTIHFKVLNKIVTGSSCSVKTEGVIAVNNLMVAAIGEFSEVDLNVDTKYFYFYNNGAVNGIYNFKGKTQYATLRAFGATILNADSLIATYTKAENSSVANMQVFASEKLDAILSSKGNIYYFGNPSEVQILEQSSTGKLIKAD